MGGAGNCVAKMGCGKGSSLPSSVMRTDLLGSGRGANLILREQGDLEPPIVIGRGCAQADGEAGVY